MTRVFLFTLYASICSQNGALAASVSVPLPCAAPRVLTPRGGVHIRARTETQLLIPHLLCRLQEVPPLSAIRQRATKKEAHRPPRPIRPVQHIILAMLLRAAWELAVEPASYSALANLFPTGRTLPFGK